jgi:predicted PurR-regulated permease PerM
VIGGIIVRALGIIVSLAVAGVIAYTTSWGLGLMLALACLLYQVILQYGRPRFFSEPASSAPGYTLDVVRLGVFLIPLIGAVLSGAWLAVVATVVVCLINLLVRSLTGTRSNRSTGRPRA